jgi:hypothetical protein
MAEEQRIVLPVLPAYKFGIEKGLEREINEIREMDIEWDLSYTTTVRRGYVLDLFQQHGILDEFISKHWPYGATPSGQTYRRRYLQIKQRYLDFLAGRGSAGQIETEEGETTETATLTFELEAQLRDFIAQNLSAIVIPEKRLTLYVDETGRNGIEFPTDVGPIDILAVDQNRAFVVFELKRGASPDRAIGQLARYMGWIKQNLAKGREVYGVIVAKEIGDKLRYAITVLPRVSLFQYEVEFHLQPADAFSAPG